MNNRISISISFLAFFILFFIACSKDKPDTNDLYDGTLLDFREQFKFPKIEVPSTNPLTIAKVDLGRKLFYDEQLSKSKTMSCSSCHNQARAFTDDGLVKSTNDLGVLTARNSMPLFNLVWVNKGMFWDGRVLTLEDAVDDAINNEQHPEWEVTLEALKHDANYANEFAKAFEDAKISQENINKALASFLRTIVSQDSKFDKALRGQVQLTALERYGLDSLFLTETGDCFHCHGIYPFMSDHSFHDNALQNGGYLDLGLGGVNGNPYDEGKMRSPSLRNLSFTAPYMHDGRFATIEEVIEFYSTGQHVTPNVDPLMKQVNRGGFHLDENHVLPDGSIINQKEALIAFLKTLDDDVFINNEAYKSPF